MTLPILNLQKDWQDEVNKVEQFWIDSNKIPVRDLSKLINKSKSWANDSLRLAWGLRVYPWISKERNRSEALKELCLRERKRKTRR
jgi:hypothetical protein